MGGCKSVRGREEGPNVELGMERAWVGLLCFSEVYRASAKQRRVWIHVSSGKERERELQQRSKKGKEHSQRKRGGPKKL
jgi:hypothetical protein